MDARRPQTEGQVHGLRSSGLPGLRPPCGDPQADVRAPEPEVLRAGDQSGGNRAPDPARGAPGTAAVDQRRVLLGRGPSGDRPAQGVLHAHLRRGSRHGLERSRARAGGQQPHNPPAIGIHRTGAAEASPAGRQGLDPSRLDRRALANLGSAGLAWFLLLAIAFTGYFVIWVPLHREILANDLTLVYIGARTGLDHGWTNLYSLGLQHQLFAQLRPHQVFHTGEWYISPPIYAWLVIPLVPLGPEVITYIWLVILVACLGAAWWMAAPGAMPRKGLWLLGALAWYPLVYSIGLVQPALILMLILAAAWRLSRAGRPYLAGAVLGLSVLKPQLRSEEHTSE